MENNTLKVAIDKEFLDDLERLEAQYNLNDLRVEKISKKANETQEEEEVVLEELGLSD